MSIPERDVQSSAQPPADRGPVPAPGAAAFPSDATDPSDLDGKPAYAEQDMSQLDGGVFLSPEEVAAGKADKAGRASAEQVPVKEAHAAEPIVTEPVVTEPVVTEPVATGPVATGSALGAYSEQAGAAASGSVPGVRVVEVQGQPVSASQTALAAGSSAVPSPRAEGGMGGKGAGDEASVLSSLKDTLLSRTEGLRQRGGQLAQTARLRMEVMQYGRDLESLYARLGRAYHHRSNREILDLIEAEIAQVEADIALRERQLGSQEVSREFNAQRLQAERARPGINLPGPTVPSVASAISVEERAPRVEHYLETDKRDTFFGLDKGGADQQMTVAGGNAAFDTQIDAETSVVSLEELEKADNR